MIRIIRVIILLMLLMPVHTNSKAQPGPGQTCINISAWRTQGQMVKVKLKNTSGKKYKRKFMVSATDSVIVFQNRAKGACCTLKTGKRSKKIYITYTDIFESFAYILTDNSDHAIDLITSGTIYNCICSGRKSTFLTERLMY